MAIRQYIGARYVPRFIGTYDVTQTYEALDVVDNGSGTSYIARKTVPAGTALTDTEYWFLYGSSSGAIVNLQQQIDAINVDITELDDRINATIGRPEDFGAAGDGLANDTAAFQTCVNNCLIVICKGTYLIDSTINVPEGVKIYGNGSGTIKSTTSSDVLKLAGNNEIIGLHFTDNLTPTASTASVVHADNTKHIKIEDCLFDTIGNSYCILIEHCENIEIRFNRLINYAYAGIFLLDSCKYADIEFNYVYNARYNGGQNSYPISFSGYILSEHGPAEHIKVNFNHIEALTPNWEGIDSHGAKYYEVRGNYIKGTLCGMNLGSKPTSIATVYADANSNSIVADNYIEVGSSNAVENPYGIQVSMQPNCIARNLVIKNNYFKVTAVNTQVTAICSGVSIRGNGGAECVEISNNTFEVANRHGIALEYGPHRQVTIRDNYFKLLSTSSSSVYYACIMLKDITVYDNIIIKNNSAADNFSGCRFLTGTTVAPESSRLVECEENDDKGMTSGYISYSTMPDNVLVSATKALGINGQFKPNNGTGDIIGWYCRSAGNWLSISGTAV